MHSVTRTALKKLFSDPRFNVMDGLDVYIGDYSKPDPIDPAIVRTLVQARYIFNPPATRVNAEGYVEDVPAASRGGGGDNRTRSPTAQPAAGAAPGAHRRCRYRRARAHTGDAAAIGTGAQDNEHRRSSTVPFCTCNGTMPLDATRSRARSSCPTLRVAHDAVPEGARALSPTRVARRRRRRLHAGAAAVRRRRRKRPARRRRSASSTSARPPAGRPRRAPRRRRSPRCSPLAALPDPEPVPRVSYQSEGQLLIVGPRMPRCTGRTR